MGRLQVAAGPPDVLPLRAVSGSESGAGQGPRSPLGTGQVASGEDGEQNSELGCPAEGTGSWLCRCWTQSIGAFSPAERTLILNGIHDALRFQFVRINLRVLEPGPPST